MREFINLTNLPCLATPMGKGVIRDDDPHSVASARTHVLLNADVIFLAGARLNWILHFGLPPRFKKGVKIIQLDNDPFEAHTNLESSVTLLGDAKAVLGQLNKAYKTSEKGPILKADNPWWKVLGE